MSLYDTLDIIRDINDDVYTNIIKTLSRDGNKTNQIKTALQRSKKVVPITEEYLQLSQVLTPMEYADFEERVS